MIVLFGDLSGVGLTERLTRGIGDEDRFLILRAAGPSFGLKGCISLKTLVAFSSNAYFLNFDKVIK